MRRVIKMTIAVASAVLLFAAIGFAGCARPDKSDTDKGATDKKNRQGWQWEMNDDSESCTLLGNTAVDLSSTLTLPSYHTKSTFWTITYYPYTAIAEHAFDSRTELGDWTIGDTYTYIGDYAFCCSSIREVSISNAVIGDWAFWSCSRLNVVSLGSGVTSIGRGAFSSCEYLDAVYYQGSIEDWEQVQIGSDNESLEEASIWFYSDTKPEDNDPYNYWRYANGKIVEW